MLKFIAPLAAAVALSWAGSAGAAVVGTLSGIIQDDGFGPELYSWWPGSGAPSLWLEQGARYTFTFESDATPIYGGVAVQQYIHFHQHDENGVEYGGNDGTYYDIYSPLGDQGGGSLVWHAATITPTGFAGSFVTPKDYIDTDVSGAYTEYWFSSDIGFHMSFDDSAAGASYRLVITAVPEPSTWAMMILGFGLAGSALRRRQAVIA